MMKKNELKRHLFVIVFMMIVSASLFGKSVYVSSSCGNDANNGFSSQLAIRTLQHSIAIKADTLFLKAGDTFYEPLGQMENVVVTRYGKGVNPRICGLRQIRTPNWKKVSDSIWLINLAEDNYVGAGTAGSSMQNNVGCIYEYDKDQVHGRKVQYRSEMTQDWDIWQTDRFEKDVDVSEFDNLYLFLSYNPNDLNLSFSIYNTAANLKNATLDGVDIVGFGFGIGAKSNTCICNCHLDIIGGRTMIGNSSFICYGNGIEFYVSDNIDNCIVEHCTISRCYDCGVTIQASNRGNATPRNIIIRNNLIAECCQGWEDFLRNNPDVRFENCVFENNVVVNSGKSGFGYPESRFKYCHVLGNNISGDRGMIIRNNVFAGGNYYCSGAYQGKYMSNQWFGNICYIRRGEYLLSNYTGSKDVIRIPAKKGEYDSLSAATNAAIAEYRKLTGDMTTKFIVVSDRETKRRVKVLVNNFNKHIL